MRTLILCLALFALAACESPDINEPLPLSSNKQVDPTLKEAVAEAEQANDWAAAAEYYHSLFERSPNDEKLALRYARSLRYAGYGPEAAAALIPFTDKHPKNAALLFELGKDLVAASQPARAVEVFKKALTLEPRSWEILSALGIAYDYQDMSAEAQESYLKALDIAPENPVVLNNLALSQAKSGALPIAIATLERAARQPRARMQVRQNLAVLLAYKGDAQNAERLARQDLPSDMAGRNAALFRLFAAPEN
ncbi:MAG: pilus assembly protein TadD [Alphaproteobacteria bacterium]|nr:pilus assembly protein TadD [Alphaproteobacteria bacterium]